MMLQKIAKGIAVVVLASTPVYAAGSQIATSANIQNVMGPYSWQSGAVKNTGQAIRVAASHRIKIPSAVGLRIHFGQALPGAQAYVRITTRQDRKVLNLNDAMIRGFNFSTPYLNGGEALVELMVRPGGSSPGISIRGLEAPKMVRAQRSICGQSDDRVASQAAPVARMVKAMNGGAGCTGTLIGPTCMVSAGHCAGYLNVAQFNVPASNSNGSPNFPAAEHQYPIAKVYAYKNDGVGQDWAVYRMNANPVSGKLPGSAQGFMKIAPSVPSQKAAIRITGHGSDQGAANFTQQTHVGPFFKLEGTAMRYVVDTEPGNSGSAVVLEDTQEVIGIHTHGGCFNAGGQNAGTSLAGNAQFQDAVRQCLEDDRHLFAR